VPTRALSEPPGRLADGQTRTLGETRSIAGTLTGSREGVRDGQAKSGTHGPARPRSPGWRTTGDGVKVSADVEFVGLVLDDDGALGRGDAGGLERREQLLCFVPLLVCL
jgi:hypothetical protein